MANKPNILLIIADQHRGDAMGCAGNPAARTPNLDRIAAEGVVFGRCNTSSPVCTPARASLLSGQYVNEHGAWVNNFEADQNGPSHVRNIRDAGYRTAVFGKTHFRPYQLNDGHVKDHASGLNALGYIDTHELKDTIPYTNHRCYYSDFLEERGRLGAYQDYTRVYRRAESRGALRPWEQTPNLIDDDEHLDIYCANKAAEYIRNYDDDRPFYLQVSLTGPHPPFDSPPEYRALFAPEDMPPAIMETPTEPVSPQVKSKLASSRLESMTENQSRMWASHYYSKIFFDDYAIGLVLQSMQERGLMENTWIVYTSDHGEMMGDHRIAEKGVFYEGALNIPFIVRPPGGTSPWKSNALTDHYDVTDTLIDAAGAEPLDNSHGVSQIPKIQAGPDAPGAQDGKEVVYSEISLYSMARNDQYKMTIDSLTREPLELYDMVNDPKELHNLVNEPSLKPVRDHFLEEYFSQLLANMNQEQLKIYQDTKGKGTLTRWAIGGAWLQ